MEGWLPQTGSGWQCGGCGEVFQFTMPVHDICRIVIGVSPVSHVQVHSGAESVGRKRVEPVGLAFRPILYVEQFFGLVYVRQDGGIDSATVLRDSTSRTSLFSFNGMPLVADGLQCV